MTCGQRAPDDGKTRPSTRANDEQTFWFNAAHSEMPMGLVGRPSALATMSFTSFPWALCSVNLLVDARRADAARIRRRFHLTRGCIKSDHLQIAPGFAFAQLMAHGLESLLLFHG